MVYTQKIYSKQFTGTLLENKQKRLVQNILEKYSFEFDVVTVRN